MKKVLRLDAKDNVAIALEAIHPGDQAKVGEEIITIISEVPMPHKFALCDMDVDTIIYKYGEPIGYATQPIKKGEWIHDHNLDAEKLMVK